RKSAARRKQAIALRTKIDARVSRTSERRRSRRSRRSGIQGHTPCCRPWVPGLASLGLKKPLLHSPGTREPLRAKTREFRGFFPGPAATKGSQSAGTRTPGANKPCAQIFSDRRRKEARPRTENRVL